jgi:hypothetical protein
MTGDLRLAAPTLSSESFSPFENSQNVKMIGEHSELDLPG